MKAIKTKIKYNDKSIEILANKMTFFDEFYVDFVVEKLEKKEFGIKGQRLKMTLHPKEDINIQAIDIQIDKTYSSTDKVFCNGYQSWSESREFGIKENIPSLRKIARPLKYWMGDEHIKNINRSKGWLHSWTYSYVRSENKFSFIGSLSDDKTFLLIQHDIASGKVHLEPDCEGLLLQHSFPILDIVLLEGQEKKCFDTYFSLAEIQKPTANPAIGWTSWYYHYTNISEEIILKNLETWKYNQVAKKEVEFNQIFQIDDGWQSAVGDWLSLSKGFPNNLSKISKAIKDAGFIPGLWLAPFVVDTRSDIFKKHDDWLVKDKNNTPLRIGYTPLWEGSFYALDFYKKEVQDYLTTIFLTILEKWGFSMLKLDFLYAVCIMPRKNKTRGQIMNDAMIFIRNIVGNHLILGCGVPLSSAFGKVDYCRIGADIHLEWEHKLLCFLRDRERVSTIISLRSTLGRWQLNNRAFLNDPDVFILRKEKNKLSPTQQYTILIINTLLGSLVFTSDDLQEYDEEQMEEFHEVKNWLNSTVKQVEQLKNNKYTISFTKDKIRYCAYCNLDKKEQFFNFEKDKIKLMPFETLILKV